MRQGSWEAAVDGVMEALLGRAAAGKLAG